MSDASPWRFSGFPEGPLPQVNLPDLLFSELVPHIDDLHELQLTLVVLWRLARMRGSVAPWLTHAELLEDATLRLAWGAEAAAHLELALARAVARGTLLLATWERGDGQLERRIFANGPRGRAAVAALQQGESPVRATIPERPNIFALYEQNIGALTPLLSEELQEAEATYPLAWIEEAFREAVRRNKRSWRYIRAILERWQAEGKDEIRRRDRKALDWRDIEGDYTDLIQH